jgi:class 3 adenylate cyclase
MPEATMSANSRTAVARRSEQNTAPAQATSADACRRLRTAATRRQHPACTPRLHIAGAADRFAGNEDDVEGDQTQRGGATRWRAGLGRMRALVRRRKQQLLTFCLTDIEDSSRLWNTIPTMAPTVLERHAEVIERAVRRHRGRLISHLGEGDSTFSVFERPSDCVRAAAAIVRALDAERWPDGEKLRLRVGIHTGEVEIRHRQYVGVAVWRAARLRNIASGGEIMMSRVTADLVADSLQPGMALLELGSFDLRGLARPEIVVELVLTERQREMSDNDVSSAILHRMDGHRPTVPR